MLRGVTAGLAAALGVSGSVGPICAADWGARHGPALYAPSPLSAYDWTGGYFGLNLGYHWGRVTNFAGGRPGGAAGGVQAGYNWQVGQFVFGGETDLQLSGARDTFAAWQFSNPWFGSLRARAGFAMNNVLFYATAGLSYGSLQIQFNGASETQRHLGLTTGAGVEVGLSRQWSARAEYLFNDLSDRGYVLTGVNNGFESNLLRFGVNYRF
jgi:outer membrane immunogenic protein